MIKKFFAILFLVFFLFPGSVVHAQEEVGYKNILVLEHISKNKFKILKENKKVKYWLKEDPKNKVKGRLDSIADSIFIIGDRAFTGSEIKKIAARTTGMGILHASGGVLLGTGTAISSVGGYLIYYGYVMATDACGGVFAVAFGVTFMVVGVAVVIISAVPLLITNKKYKLDKNWILKIEKVPVDWNKRTIVKHLKGKL